MTSVPGRIAVVGGGVFGAWAAVELARAGYGVDLFERQSDLLRAASGINQYRLHRGYHYPRSLTTAIECRAAEAEFRSIFPAAVVDSNDHYYAIAAVGSRTSAEAYRAFCHRAGLQYEVAELDVLRPGASQLVVRVREALFDAGVLRSILWEDLHHADVRVHLGTEATDAILEGFDLAVVATYADINQLSGGRTRRPYQFEVCEKPVVRLPPRYSDVSVVVMDGEFMCADPLPGTDLHVLGNVVHAIHHTSIGTRAEVPDRIRPLLNRGIVPSPPVTNIGDFVAAGAEFLVDFDLAEHVGSMYTVRAVLPDVDETDERPTLIQRVDGRRIAVFSGKIDTCVRAARETVELVDAMVAERYSPAANERRLG